MVDATWVTLRHASCVIGSRNHTNHAMTRHLPGGDPPGVINPQRPAPPPSLSPEPPRPPRTIASVAPGPRRTIASYTNYADAESAVDWLADQGFPVERGAIVGTGLRSVEQMEGRLTAGRAALIGAGAGVLLGALLALLAGLLPWDWDAEVAVSVVAAGALFGALFGALIRDALSAGRRDFLSFTRIEADRYEVQIDADAAGEARRLLDGMPEASR